MVTLGQVFRKHLGFARRYPLAFGLVQLISLIVVCNAWWLHRLAHAFGYIFAVWLGAFVTDVVVALNPKPAIGFPIKRPAIREVVTICVCILPGMLFLFVRYEGGWETINPYVRIAFIPLLLFAFPIVLAAIYLFRYKYKLRELGVNLRYWYLPIFIHVIMGGVTLWLAYDKSHWAEEFNRNGIGELYTGLVVAALSEEFLRMLLQTRLGAALRNVGLGFVLASIIWAFMHLPNFAQNYKTEGWGYAVLGVIDIIPIGLLWGYVTHRTKSLIPSIFIHGLNLWGLQNFY